MTWDQIEIVCWKWNNGLHPKKKMIFGADHVNTLASMLHRHVHIPFRLSCVTDDPVGIDPSVRIIPIWDDYRDKGGCFLRLRAFAKEMKDLIGPRICSIDLDTVITRDITPLLDHTHDFVVWGDAKRSAPYCGSFWVMTAGSRVKVWDEFDHRVYQPTAAGKYSRGTDQARISDALYPNEKMVSKADGVFNFESDLRMDPGLEALQCGFKATRDRRRAELERGINEGHKTEIAKIKDDGVFLTDGQIVERLNQVTQSVINQNAAQFAKAEETQRRRLASAMRQNRVQKSIHKTSLPQNVRLVFFNGAWDPNNISLQNQYPWIQENYK